MVQKHSNRLSWDDLEAILLVATHGSVRRAAETVALAHTTLAKRIAAAERSLGIVAFVKSQRGYVLTRAGEQAVERINAMSLEARKLRAEVAGADDTVAGEVRISLFPAVVTHVLAPALAELGARHPCLTLKFQTAGAFADLDRNRSDIAIRFQDQPSAHLWGQRVATTSDAVYGAHAVLERHQNRTNTPPLIGWTDADRVRKRAHLHGLENPDVQFTTANLEVQMALAQAGLGLAILPCYIGDPDSRLARLNVRPPQRINDAWVLTHPDFRASRRIMTVMRFCATAMRDHAKAFAGNA